MHDVDQAGGDLMRRLWRLWVLLALVAVAALGFLIKTWPVYVVALAALFVFLRVVANGSKKDVLRAGAVGATQTVFAKPDRVAATVKLYTDAGWQVIDQTSSGRSKQRGAIGVGPLGVLAVGAVAVSNRRRGRVAITFRKS
jgi:hypothetical protein